MEHKTKRCFGFPGNPTLLLQGLPRTRSPGPGWARLSPPDLQERGHAAQGSERGYVEADLELNSKCAAHQLGGHVQSKPQFLICVRRPAALPSKRLGLNGILCQEPHIQLLPSLQPRLPFSHALHQPRPSLQPRLPFSHVLHQPRPSLQPRLPFSHALPSVWLPDPAPGFSGPAWEAGHLFLAAGGTCSGVHLWSFSLFPPESPETFTDSLWQKQETPTIKPLHGALGSAAKWSSRTSRVGERRKGNFLLLVEQS